MTLTVETKVLSIIASIFVVIAGLYGFAGFVKRGRTRRSRRRSSRAISGTISNV